MAYGIMDIGRNAFGLSSHSERLRPSEFWAVNDVSFEVKRGGTLGLIGANGSGKTTLLKLINGIFWPDKGRITVKGRVGALIAVGAGFHPLLTGRENVYVNGAILGMSKREIQKKFDAIVEFADIGDFLDVPVKYYSSGMFVKLGFSVAAHSEPDILLVDEVLAVGDMNFGIKCLRKMHELKKRTDVSIIIVSHAEYVLRAWSQKCVVLDQGRAVYHSDSDDAIAFYTDEMSKRRLKEEKRNGSIFQSPMVKGVKFRNASGDLMDGINPGERITIEIEYQTEQKIRDPIFGIDFYDPDGQLIGGLYNSYESIRLPDIEGKGVIRVIVDPFILPSNSYRCEVKVFEEEISNIIERNVLETRLLVKKLNNMRGSTKLNQKWECFSNTDGADIETTRNVI